MTKPSDKAILKIVKGCIRKIQSAQRALYEALFDHVAFCIRSFNFSIEEQEDLMQEVFIKLFCNINSFDNTKANIYTWSSIIANRTCLSFIRKKKIKFEQWDAVKVEIGMEDLQSDFLELDILHRLIEDLPMPAKEVFKLSVFQGLTHDKISNLLHIETNASRSYLSRAKATLRKEVLNHNDIAVKYLKQN